MLELKKLTKSYKVANFEQMALDGVSINFRESEFVSILGPSGSGKTTLLNIVGGLDTASSGDLVIDGVSTKKYKDKNWDTYRNNKVGFVFQNYNLIPHQSVLVNVELALSLAGVSKTERKKRAVAALDEVGLSDHINKKPAQLSGGQMQRVAIARALVNNPEIILADEPTGALDSKTSVLIMKTLKDISKSKLVIMVTHNDELAHEYSTRIVKLADGKIIDDTKPFQANKQSKKNNKIAKQSKMNFLTALSLSLSNLMTKKGRTFMTAFAGSIGIIGIALVMALSNGINNYVKDMEENTMSEYPISINKTSMNLAAMMGGIQESHNVENSSENSVEEMNIAGDMFGSMKDNDLKSLKEYINDHQADLDPLVNNIEYKYGISPQIYQADTGDGAYRVHPAEALDKMGMNQMAQASPLLSSMGGMAFFTQTISNMESVKPQYDVLAGRWPEKHNEIIMNLERKGAISDLELYILGLRPHKEFDDLITDYMNGDATELPTDKHGTTYSYDEIMGQEFKLILPTDTFVYDKNLRQYVDKSKDKEFMKKLVASAETIKIVGIVTANDNDGAHVLASSLNYLPSLTKHIVDKAAETDIVKKQLASPKFDVISGKSFEELAEKGADPLDFGKFFSVDQGAIEGAFKFDQSAFGDLSFDNNKLMAALPTDFPAPDLSGLASLFPDMSLLPPAPDPSDLVKYPLGPADPQYQIDFQAYLAAVQTMMSALSPANMQSQMQGIIAVAMKDSMTTYTTKMMTALSTGIAQQMKDLLPEKMKNAMSVDTDAFKNAIKMSATEDDITDMIMSMMGSEEATYENNLTNFGYAFFDSPSSIDIYAKDFDSKQKVKTFLEDYNAKQEAENQPERKIEYSDLIGTLMSSVTNIIDMVSYGLIAFISISLVVSSIMIGVITYISVLERRKEIGILRAIGARKSDIKNIFNAETTLTGLIAGLLGVGVAWAITFPANMILENLSGIKNLAILPIVGAVALVAISVFLNFIAGLIPATSASKKDAAEALRSE